MNEQEHIHAIGKATVHLEEVTEELGRVARKQRQAVRALHSAMDRAQAAYLKQRPAGNIVAFSGGTNKPPPGDPDKPVDPVPGP